MRLLRLAVTAVAALYTMSVLCAFASQAEVKIPAEDDSVHYCRTHLSDEEKLLYDSLLTCALSEDPTELGEGIIVSCDPGGDEFRTSFHKVYNAVLFDHPELFWLSMGSSIFQYSYRNNLFDGENYSISFKMSESYPDRQEQMEELEAAADSFLEDIDLSGTEAETALLIHDKLIDLVSYDKEVAAGTGKDLAHTAYGALVANSSGEANTAVCDGYSYAYEYLLQKAGIRSTIITGYAGDSEENAGSHSWNLVELDGEWYEVDSTWNDISSEETLDEDAEYSAIAEEAMNSSWYTDKLTHFLFNVTTDEISYFEPDEDYRYTNDQGWVSFLGRSVHIRHTEEESASTGDYMTPLAPIADGTHYSYDELLKR